MLSKKEFEEKYINTIQCSDCLEVMAGWPDNCVDTIITDPPYGLSFMGKKWDYDVPSIEIWQACLRVLKPGGTLLCFAGSRTQHRMAVNVEDAGFILKDCIMYLYGSGFPKATDISKQLDKGHEREVVAFDKTKFRKDNDNCNTYAKHCGQTGNITAPTTPEAQLWNGWKSHGLKPAYEPILVAMKPNDGTYAANALKWGVSGLNINGGRIGTDRVFTSAHKTLGDGIKYGKSKPFPASEIRIGRFPANIILDEEAGRMLDEQSGVSKSTDRIRKNNQGWGDGIKYGKGNAQDSYGFTDSGGASRFFKNIKADKTCSLCYNLATKEFNKESELWTLLNATNVKQNLETTSAIAGSIALLNAMPRASKSLVLNVKSAGNLCDLCAIGIARSIVATQQGQDLDLLRGKGFIRGHKGQILSHCLALFVESQVNIDTIPTMASLSLFFGYVQNAIQNYTPTKEMGGEFVPTRFRYVSKASKAERNAGCEGLEEVKTNDGRQVDADNAYQRGKSLRKNSHPTVKPLALMEYLCRLTATPTGGIVLDPFCGSGTTCMACVNEGRDYIGIDKSDEYVEIAKLRVARAVEQRKGQMGLFNA